MSPYFKQVTFLKPIFCSYIQDIFNIFWLIWCFGPPFSCHRSSMSTQSTQIHCKFIWNSWFLQTLLPVVMTEFPQSKTTLPQRWGFISTDFHRMFKSPLRGGDGICKIDHNTKYTSKFNFCLWITFLLPPTPHSSTPQPQQPLHFNGLHEHRWAQTKATNATLPANVLINSV